MKKNKRPELPVEPSESTAAKGPEGGGLSPQQPQPLVNKARHAECKQRRRKPEEEEERKNRLEKCKSNIRRSSSRLSVQTQEDSQSDRQTITVRQMVRQIQSDRQIQ